MNPSENITSSVRNTTTSLTLEILDFHVPLENMHPLGSPVLPLVN